MVDNKRKKFIFDVAISYAGEEVGIADDLYQMLKQKRVDQKRVKVFFAKPSKAYLWGKSLPPALRKIFGGVQTKFVIPIISKHYIEKKYTKLEFREAKKEEKRRRFEVILPIILDSVRLQGLESDRNYIDLRKEGIHSTVNTIIEKIKQPPPYEPYAIGAFYAPIMPPSAPTHWIATFGVTIEHLLTELPSSAPTDYVSLCDWLEKDLMERLYRSSLKQYRFLEDMRTGETLSIRIGFEWDPEEQPLDFGDIGWWEVLEIAEHEEIRTIPIQREETMDID